MNFHGILEVVENNGDNYKLVFIDIYKLSNYHHRRRDESNSPISNKCKKSVWEWSCVRFLSAFNNIPRKHNKILVTEFPYNSELLLECVFMLLPHVVDRNEFISVFVIHILLWKSIFFHVLTCLYGWSYYSYDSSNHQNNNWWSFWT